MVRGWCYLFVALSAPCVHAEIFRCAGTTPLPVYQNFPCRFDSAGAASEPARATAVDLAKAASPSKREAAPRGPLPQVPRPGMTSAQVKAIWGEPIDTSSEENAIEDVEVWTYPGSRSIRFDRKRRVIAVRW